MQTMRPFSSSARRLPSHGIVRGSAPQLFGLALGALLAVLALLWLAMAVVMLLVLPKSRRARSLAHAGTARLVALDRRRLARWMRCEITERPDAARLGYLLCRIPLGLLSGYLIYIALFMVGLFFGGAIWSETVGEGQWIRIELPGADMSSPPWFLGALLGVLMVVATVLGTALTAALDRALALRFLGPDLRALLERRIGELTASRAGVLAAVDDERRRIERDLHDGVQQRTVALAMLLGRARRRGDAGAAELLRQAHDESLHLVDEVREVAWRVYPRSLDELGLRASLDTIAEKSAVPITVRYELTRRPASAIETALYFVAREAITNAVKHAEATEVSVALGEDVSKEVFTVEVGDDGRGGADPNGGGLLGLGQRVAALDGTLEVRSPPGGPTIVAARIPFDRLDVSAPSTPGAVSR